MSEFKPESAKRGHIPPRPIPASAQASRYGSDAEAHPSYSQPKCIACKQFEPVNSGHGPRCNHPSNGLDLVSGQIETKACHHLRAKPAKGNDICGEEGHWFESSTDCAAVQGN